MTEPTDTAPAPCAEPKPCCKCEAYREIIRENAARIAELEKRHKDIAQFAHWIANLAEKGTIV